ncbi:MAG: efflux RND transporter permease subunit [Nitrospirae bacterium]|nr:efflux RND transporter permease subunit [Candidatus Manganitrophaceae bacterium]
MIRKIIEGSINNRFLILFFTVLIVIGGLIALKNTPLDAIPDLSDVQVIIQTDYPGQDPQVVEDQVTYSLTTAMLSVPYAKLVRGYSFFGVSFVYIIFEDGTDMYWARSRVLEYLNFVSDRLPANVTPKLGPDATGVGWVYQYILVDKTGKHDLADLRSIQDWYLRYELQTVPGVSEVASIGGFVKQYQVTLDPNKLLSYNIPLKKITEAIRRSNNDVGGRLLEMAETEYMVRGIGYIKSVEDLKTIPIGLDHKGTPILLKDVAHIHIGPEIRRGLIDFNGEGDAVSGIVVMRFGENALEVINNVKARLETLKKGLPEGVEVVTVYDRSSLIERAIETLEEKLLEEIIVVAIVCVVFLLHFRSALVAVLVLPVSILIAFSLMYLQGINANIMSLSGIAIAIGAMLDGAIVMIENAHKHLERGEITDRWQAIGEAAKEVGPALFFSLLIITVSFMPVFTLQAQEGRLFAPLAFTKTYAMAASAFLSITLVPVLMGYLIRGRIIPEKKNPIVRALLFVYHPILKTALRFKITVIVLAILIMGATIIPLEKLGSEFMPPLNEGDILYMPSTLPGISITKVKEILQQTDRIIKTFPEVHHVLGKAGRAETATDPAPLNMIETLITLKPPSEWREGLTMEKLVEEMDAALDIPGISNAWTMPIKTRIDMLSTGIKTPVGIKVAGEDLEVLAGIGKRLETILKKVPGTLSVYSERVVGGNFVDIKIHRKEASRYGLTVGDIQDVIQTAFGGMNITYTVEGLERYPVNLRYSRSTRENIGELKRMLIPTPMGRQIPLIQVADIQIKRGAPVLKSENSRLNAWTYIDLRGIDVGTYVANAQKVVAAELDLPQGYTLLWSGQYEYMERAQARLKLVIPLTIMIIFLLLYFNFKSVAESLLVMLSLPFSFVGGVWLMYFLDYNMSVAVGVGFIALAGLSVELAVVMLVYLDLYYKEHLNAGTLKTRADLFKVILEGAGKRIRPVIMTLAITVGGLLPIMWGTGTGSQVMKRIAAPMVGGMLSSTILTLLVIPVIYALWKGRGLKEKETS